MEIQDYTIYYLRSEEKSDDGEEFIHCEAQGFIEGECVAMQSNFSKTYLAEQKFPMFILEQRKVQLITAVMNSMFVVSKIGMELFDKYVQIPGATQKYFPDVPKDLNYPFVELFDKNKFNEAVAQYRKNHEKK